MFVVGCPRSGTSLLATMVELHPGVALLREAHFLDQAMLKVAGVSGQRRQQSRLWAAYEHDQHFVKQGFSPEDVCALGRELTPRTFYAAMMRMHAHRSEAAIMGEKTPSNFRYISTMLEWFPNARIVFAVRDARSVVASILARWQTSLVDAVKAWNAAAAAAQRWSSDGRVMLVPYERMTAEPEAMVAQVYGHLELDFDPAWLAKRLVEDVRLGYGSINAGSAITQGQVGLWRERLTASQVRQVEWAARRGMAQLGYLPENHLAGSWAFRAARAGSELERIVRAGQDPQAALGRLRSRRSAERSARN
ncbi:MAG: sulfotransferase family protein [Mycobacteriales bacterium]